MTLMTSTQRLGLAARAFALATVLGLTWTFQVPKALQGSVVLMALGGIALAALQYSYLDPRWIGFLEGFLAALNIGLTLPDGSILLPYLVVPALVVGVSSGARAVVLVAGGEMLALILVLGLGGAAAPLRVGLILAAPWAVASLGAGLLGWWVTRLRGTAGNPDDESYQSARRLLSQLRTVARRLSSGLDPVSLAGQTLGQVNEALRDWRSAVFVRTEGGFLAPLAYLGQDAQQTFHPSDPLVETCWAEMEPACAPAPSGAGHRVVLPLRSGSRMVGVVISDCDSVPDLSGLLRDLDEQALRLDTALIFDEVRSLATIEERHRLAREIHDGVAQEVASLGYLVDDLAADAVTEPQGTKVATLRNEITRVVGELRLSIFDLRSEVTPDVGLGSALSDYVRAVGARSGLTVHLRLDEGPTRLRREVETELFRIAQEAVTNVRKHARAKNLWVDCHVRPPFAALKVEDDGEGLGHSRDDSYGLKIMRERANRIGARLEVGGKHADIRSSGTRVAVIVGDEPTACADGRTGEA